MQAGAYQNGTWVVGVANTGNEEGVPRDAQSQIIAPSGETMSMTVTDGDELIVARCDLDLLQFLQEHDVQLRARSDRSDQAQPLPHLWGHDPMIVCGLYLNTAAAGHESKPSRAGDLLMIQHADLLFARRLNTRYSEPT
jgi:hypothetical protein